MGVEDSVDISGKTRPERKYVAADNTGLGEILDQDISNLEAVQHGLKSRGFSDGYRLSDIEMRLQVFHAEMDLYMKGLK